VVLRWERLVGRLAAAAAQRKALLLLQWLHLHLAFTEGCNSRGTWLSPKVGGRWKRGCSFRCSNGCLRHHSCRHQVGLRKDWPAFASEQGTACHRASIVVLASLVGWPNSQGL
jgi:hypothetical protein